MPSASSGKRRVKKTEKAKALEDNSDSDGLRKKAKRREDKAWSKKRVARPKALPEGDGDSDGSQNVDDDDVGGKIECVFIFFTLTSY